MLHLQNVNPSKLTELSWFKTGGIEEVDILIHSLMCKLPFTYTKCTGTQAEDKHVINQLTFFQLLLTVESPKFTLFYLFPTLQLFLFHFLSSSSITTGLHFSFSISLHSVLYSGKADRQTAGTETLPAQVTSSDSHTLEALILPQKHFNFIKGRESKLICIWVHSISSAHMFLALESPFLIPWLIQSQEGNTAQGEVRTVLLTLQEGLHSIHLAQRAQLGDLGAVSPLDFKAQTMHAELKTQIRETPTLAQEEALVRRSILQLPVCTLRGLIWGNPENIIRCLISSLAFKYIMIQFRSKPHLNTVLKSK